MINNKKYKLKITFKSVLKVFNIFSMNISEKIKVQKSLETFGFHENLSYETQRYILNEISKYIFDTSKKSVSNAKQRIFDFNYDFKYYYYDFKNIGIDLLNENISWFSFDVLLDGIMIKKDTLINQIIEYRTYERPPKIKNPQSAENLEHQQKMKLKSQFSLPHEENTENGFDKLWNVLEKKAGDSNE